MKEGVAAMRGVPGWLIVGMIGLVFWAGYCVGTASMCRTDEWVLNPVRYFFLIQQLRNSPWGWTTPELQQALRDAQAEIGVLCAGSTVVATAYWYGGPQAAFAALGYVTRYSSSLGRLSTVGRQWNNGLQEHGAEFQRIRYANGMRHQEARSRDGCPKFQKNSGAPRAQLALQTAPEIVD